MLLGREREVQVLDAAIAAARAGESRVCAIVGEAGIGKTALLDLAAERASGMQQLRARGVESEAQVPFAGLLELLRPALHLLERIPEPQAAALAGALALRSGGTGDRFTVGAATLSLLAAVAEDGPLAVLVDDVHLLDGSSAEALLFALRRLVADPIAVILTARTGEPSLLDGAALPTIQLSGLDREAARALLSQESGVPIAAEAAERLHRATGGNPLALMELGPEAPRLAAEPVDAPVPATTSVAGVFAVRAAGLPEATRRLLVLAAAAGDEELPVLARAADAQGLDVADLAPAEDAGLVTLRDGTLAFRHPLARSAVYADAPAGERRAAHRALADTLPDRDADRRAWHLAAAAIGPDVAASEALAQAGVRANNRSAYRVAAAAFERGARLASDDDRRAGLFHAAADAAWLGGLADQAEELLQGARGHPDPRVALAVEQLRGHIAARRGRLREAYEILVEAADAGVEVDSDRAAIMLAEASNASYHAGDARTMLAAATRAHDLVPADATGEAAIFSSLAYGMALVFAGQGEAGAASIRRGVELLEGPGQLGHPSLLAWAVMGPLYLREGTTGRALVERALETARRQTAIGVLPFLLYHVGRDHATGDRWVEAHAELHEGLRLARESGQLTDLATLLAALAGLEARRGREAECRAAAEESLALSDAIGPGTHDLWALDALGMLELGLGRPDAAVARFEDLERLLRAGGVDDVDLSPGPDLVEALLRLGRSEDAARIAAEYDERARAKGQPWSLARAARARALLADEAERDDLFAQAAALHARTPDVFEAARTRLQYGALLRRARHRTDARTELRAAVETFDRLGADPWTELAQKELAATGETARRRDPSTRDRLTPQELQIALLLAEGRTTREAAAAMFLSPKTIEYHQRNVYRKLDVRSRDELAAAMAAAGS